jgi:hypothetical protein
MYEVASSSNSDLKIMAHMDNFELVPMKIFALLIAIKVCQAFEEPSSILILICGSSHFSKSTAWDGESESTQSSRSRPTLAD